MDDPPYLYVFSALAVLIAVLVFNRGSPGRVRDRVLKRTRGDVRRIASLLHFRASDVASLDVSSGHISLTTGTCLRARLLRVVAAGLQLRGGRVVKVRHDGDAERSLLFPSRRAAEAFLDALAFAQGVENEPRPEQVTISLNTWNVGNAQPQTEMGSWFEGTRGKHLIVFATQECSYKVSGIGGEDAAGGAVDEEDEQGPLLGDSKIAGVSSAERMKMDPDLAANALAGNKHWMAVLRAHFPEDEYESVAEISSWDRCLSVYARKDIADKVSDVRSDTSFVGLGGVAGNKGAIGVRFKLYETDFIIVNSHLAAHQGNVAKRNQDYSVITAGLRALRDGPNTDLMTSPVHHVFWLGDLNYRIDLDREVVIEKAVAGDFASLLQADQLQRAMKANEAFVGFDEADISFAPTYRYERGNRTYASTKMRVPSYCDRILKRTLPGASASFESYSAVDTIMSSDHSPVTANVRAHLVHTRSIRTVDEIPEDGEAPLAAEVASRGISGEVRDVAARGKDVGEAELSYEIEFVHLSASNLPAMDGVRQGAASMVAQAMYGSMNTSRDEPIAATSSEVAPLPVAAPAGLCDAYVIFHGDCLAELESGEYSTETVSGSQEPTWSEKPRIALEDSVAALVRRRYIVLTVMDEDLATPDEIVGSAAIWIGDGWTDSASGGDSIVAESTFERDIMLAGKKRGTVRGTYRIRQLRLPSIVRVAAI